MEIIRKRGIISNKVGAKYKLEFDSSGNYSYKLYKSLARVNSDGRIDSNFGTGGTLFTKIEYYYDSSTFLAIGSNGQIVVAGSDSRGLSIARYNLNGSLESSFKLLNDLKNADESYFVLSSVAFQEDKKILVAGAWNNTYQNNDFVLARFTATGILDSTFEADWIVTTDFRANNDMLNATNQQGQTKK